MSSQHPSFLQPLPQQQSGFNDMQQLQQQLMFRKMQEIQRQNELLQLESRQQNSVNQLSLFATHSSGTHPHPLVNGTNINEPSTYPWADLSTGNMNSMQGHSPQSIGFIQQQVDQSFYGIPISSARGTSNQFPQIVRDKSSSHQMPSYSNSFMGNQYSVLPEQFSMHDGNLISRQGLLGKNFFGHPSAQDSNSGVNLEHLHSPNHFQRNASLQDFQGPQELTHHSEVLRDKRSLQAAAPNDAVSLDPTEEKILFGSDDNIWDAFGVGTPTMDGGASNLLDGKGFFNGFPSVQCGSWSALMQSAVAETSSNDIGSQEGWSGLSFHSPELSARGRQPPAYGGHEKRQESLNEDNLQIAPTLSFGSVPLSDGMSINNNSVGDMGVQQYGQKFLKEHDERLQINSSERPSHLSSAGSEWSDCRGLQKLHPKATQVYESISHPLDVDMNAKNSSGDWTSHYPSNKLTTPEAIEFVPPTRKAAPNINENVNTMPHSQNSDVKLVMNEEMVRAGVIWKTNSISNSSVELEPMKANVGSPQMNRESFAANGSSTRKVGEDISHLNYWKHVDSSVKSKGSESSGRSQHHLSRGPWVSESSMNGSDQEEHKTNEVESSGKKENINDGNGTRIPPLGVKLKSFNQVGQKISGPPKFHYHPMGNVDDDMESSYGSRQNTYSQATSPQFTRGLNGQDPGFCGHSNLFDQIPKSVIDAGKGQSHDLQGDSKGSAEAHSRDMLPTSVHNMFSGFNRSASLSTSNRDSQPSQNMMELLQKVDQSKERVTMRPFSSSEHNQSPEVPEAQTSDGSMSHLPRSQSLNSQGFGLQLAPPSQRLPLSNRPNAGKAVNSNSVENRSLPLSSGMSQGESMDDQTGVSGQRGDANFSSALGSGLSYVRSQLHNQQLIGARGQALIDHSDIVTLDRVPLPTRQTDVSCSALVAGQYADGSLSSSHCYEPFQNAAVFDRTKLQTAQPSAREKFPLSQLFGTSVIAQHDSTPNMSTGIWNNVPGQQHLIGAQGSTSSGLTHPGDQDVEKRGDFLFKSSSRNLQGSTEEQSVQDSPSLKVLGQIDQVLKMSDPLGRDRLIQHPPNSSALHPPSTQRDLESFVCSLKPNNLHQSYSLLNQMQPMKNTDNDPSNRGLKRLKGANNSQAGQPDIHSTAAVDNVEKNILSQLGDVTSINLLAFGQNESQNINNNRLPSIKIEQAQASPQMAPSWFNYYGTFKNGLSLPGYDSQKGMSVKAVEPQLSLGKPSSGLEMQNLKEQLNSASEASQVGVVWQTLAPSSAVTEHLSSPLSMHRNDISTELVEAGHKKRKIASSNLLPWRKEVSLGSQSLQIVRMAEVEWAKAANRLPEKAEDYPDVIEDSMPVLRPKRRLILTTKLMQQLFRPASGPILSSDAGSNYGSVVYSVAQLALGDACSLISSARSHSGVLHSEENLISSLNDKSKPSERIDDHHLAEIVEDFMSRAWKLEIDLLRLDKRAMLSDLRMECQDLEKFSVINRFARFHGRSGQVEGTDNSSSSDSATSAQRSFPQRYVTAVPMPKNLPDRVQCFSL